jgi:hypothetical protein
MKHKSFRKYKLLVPDGVEKPEVIAEELESVQEPRAELSKDDSAGMPAPISQKLHEEVCSRVFVRCTDSGAE